MADVAAREIRAPVPARPLSLHKFARRKSTIAFLTALPLIVVVACVVPTRRSIRCTWRR